VRLDGREAVFATGVPEVAVGSERGCPVRLRGEGVAARHLVLRHEGDGWVVERAEAAVYLGGMPVERLPVDRPLALRLGDPDSGPLVEVAPAAQEIASEDTTTAWREGA